MEPLVNVAVQAARQAGEFIRRNQDQAQFLEVNFDPIKGESTKVDIQAESIIIQQIRKKFPKHNILAEEHGFIDNQSDTTWIIDALDGTKNFLHGVSHFAVSIAVQQKNVIEHAVVLDPVRHECFTASKGRGAQLNNRRLRVGQNLLIPRCLIATGKFQVNENSQASVIDFYKKTAGIPSIRRMGCTSLDLAYVASGRFDAYFAYKPNPWDCAAGMLLVLEAGGVVCDFQGESQTLPPQELLAGNIKLNKGIIELS
jgi:myo-inositol-1(or 4)-monophosphatase